MEMNACDTQGCLDWARPPNLHCPDCIAFIHKEKPSGLSSGGDNDYWIAEITHPKRLDPYKAECEDLIEHFQMSFQEGEAFKALWRNGMLRIGKGKPEDSNLRNAEKVSHFGKRMVVIEARKLEK